MATLVGTVSLLPTSQEQRWLLDAMAELISLVGWEQFVSGRGLRPDEEHFPDRWTPDAHGVRRLAQRLLDYADLGDLDVEVEVFHEDRDIELDARGEAAATRHEGAAAWFAGIDGDVCLFGAELSLLGDPHAVTAAMAHEVAHAYRRAHEKERLDAEERLFERAFPKQKGGS